MAVRLARTRRRELPPDAWIADDQDHALISRPLARITARRIPAHLAEASDVIDGLEVAVGTAAYASKNLSYEAAIDAELAVTAQTEPEA